MGTSGNRGDIRKAWRRERLVIVLALLAIGGVFAAFVSIHVILTSRLLRHWVNTSPDELLLDYDSASSWVPGVIRLRGLTMRGSDPNVQWFFRMEEATISISLIDLAFKKFHATSVSARGLVFRLREKEEKSELSSAHLARLPEIPGFADPPLKTVGSPAKPTMPGTRNEYWSVWIENLVADPTPDIWIEIYRFRGHARLTGGFFLHPHQQVWIGPAVVRFLSGNLELAPGEALLSAASGQSDCVIEPYDPEKIEGTEVWRKISGNIQLDGRLENVNFANYFLRHSREPRLEGGAGTARGTLQITHGIGKGHIDFDAADIGARYAKAAVRGRASGRLEIPHWDIARNDMEISGSRVDLTSITTAGTARNESDWWGRFGIPSGRIAVGLTAQTTVECRDARPLYALFNVNLPGWAQGIFKLESLHASAGVRVAGDSLDVQNLDAAGGKFHITGDYHERKNGRSGAFLIETGLLAAGIEIDSSASHLKLLGARKWYRDRTPAPAASPH